MMNMYNTIYRNNISTPIAPPSLDNMAKKTLDPKKLVDAFILEYYNTISNIGWNNISSHYFPDAQIMVKDQLIGNYHDFVSLLTKNYIKRANYGGARTKWVVTGENSIVLNIYGTIQFVNFLGFNHDIEIFTETFILKTTEDMKLKINIHMLDF